MESRLNVCYSVHSIPEISFFTMIPFSTTALLVYSFAVSSISMKTPEIQQTTEKLEFLITNRSEIWRVDQSGNKHRYSTNTTAIGDVDYHLRKNILFWIDAEKHEIHSQSLDVNSTSFHLIFKQERNWEPVALAVDFIGDKIYSADISGVKIDVFELDGRYHSIVMSIDLIRPVDIKLDPYEGTMFVLDGLRIIRANMDGSSPISIIRQNIRTVHGMSIDIIDKRIYWSKKPDFQILSSNYSGKDMISVNRNNSSVEYPTWTKFSVFNKTVFWANEFIRYKSICYDEMLKSRLKSIYVSNPIPTVKVLYFSKETSIRNPCTNDNGGCQQMCFLKLKDGSEDEITHQCACAVGWTLDVNSRNCTQNIENFLLYTQLNILKSHLIKSSVGTFSSPYLPISEEKKMIIDFDYHYTDKNLYYLVKNQLDYDVIYRKHPNKSEPIPFLLGKHENYQSFSLNWITNSLYYTDSLEGTISVVSTRNNSKKLSLLEKLELPEDIIIHPNKGFIFFFQTNLRTKITVLSRAHVDGSNLIIFNEMPLRKRCGFTIDFNEDRIYWYDWKRNYIQHSNLNFTEIRSLQSKFTEYLYSISIYEKWIYVVSIISEGLWRLDKNTGEQTELIMGDSASGLTKIKTFSSKLRTINSNHPCDLNNGDCLEFCFGLPQNEKESLTKVCIDSDKN